MTLFLHILSRTPIWVWALLAALVALGLHQARDHEVSRLRALVQPIGLGLLSFFGAASAFGWHATVQPLWIAGFAVGMVVFPRLMPLPSVHARPGGRFAIGGSWAPLVLILAIFLLRYVGSVSLAIVPTLADLPLVAAGASALYGLPSGLLAARARRVLRAGPPALALQAA